jgi:hypothetical protein
MKRKQHSTTIPNRRNLKIFEKRRAHQSRCCRRFTAIETLWRILFQFAQGRVQR